ncbi:polysaccharide pyruvyl transferase family protein [Burkholderiaceae bacterium FT117]|uniref:polysaccharide pyruvyl transferase family protein n=1 Tax=Zeimonas sediminis TaxID=2944268 RepID=UPI002342E40E|nr:polysaccharide pyruvyl transferase family protein [Zeimonas sediminis]MCM5569915.1 polysaccharide pyruvyl transferase family protein [Zeimonas sediminis]
MLDTLKSRVPLPLKQWPRTRFGSEDFPLPDGPRALVFLAADYGNIGDIAITVAQARFLARFAGGRQVVQVPLDRTLRVVRAIRRQLRPDDLVTVVGGGNMGSLYPDIEALRQLAIRVFPGNPVICFPQSLDWDDTVASQRALARIARSYPRHRRLSLFARESASFAKLGELFGPGGRVRLALVPDIVFSLSPADLGVAPAAARAGILACLRQDKERRVSDAQGERIRELLAGAGEPVNFTDTHVPLSGLDEAQALALLQDKLREFVAARLVVTDRLHGMIFAAISGTPCVALPNATHKVTQTWRDWLQAYPGVALVQPGDEAALREAIERLLALDPAALPARPVDDAAFAALAEAVAVPVTGGPGAGAPEPAGLEAGGG